MSITKTNKITVSESDIWEGDNGACVECGEVIMGGIEPDARDYDCEHCGAQAVFGLEELLLMGRLTIA